ncbi:MAG: hypothetical protein HQM00_08945 [Magnetococcales bacterium]|nr:hypothetical protein [Magnetococcales bacterium]
MTTRFIPATGDPLSKMPTPGLVSMPELFGLLIDQSRLTERMAILMEEYLQFGDPDLIANIQRLESEGVFLRKRNVEWLKGLNGAPLDRDALMQACFFAEAVQGVLAGIVTDMDTMGMPAEWSILEMAVQLRHTVERLRIGHEKLIYAPAEVIAEVEAILKMRKSMEKSYRAALARLLDSADQPDQNFNNPDGIRRIFHVFRHRELYRRFRDGGIEIANCGRVLQDIARQFV